MNQLYYGFLGLFFLFSYVYPLKDTFLTLDLVSISVYHWQVVSVSNMFVKHPDVAVDIRSDIREVKTAYMNILLGLVQTLDKPPQSLSETELSNADSELSELTDAGFKLDWLKSKLEEVSLKRKEPSSHLKVELDKQKIESTAAPAPRVSPFECIVVLIKKFFLACFAGH